MGGGWRRRGIANCKLGIANCNLQSSSARRGHVWERVWRHEPDADGGGRSRGGDFVPGVLITDRYDYAASA